MKFRNFLAAIAVLLISYSPAGTAGVQAAGTTLAILPFENNSVTEAEKYAPLSNGLSAMLITDLSKSGSALQPVERSKIKSILKEIALSQQGLVDESTALEAGKILGAQTIAIGSFMVLGKTVRVDLRIIKVETSEVLLADSVTGESRNFLKLEKELATKIAESFKGAQGPDVSGAESGIDAALYFSKGLEAIDRGADAEAKRMFDKCIEMDPAYKAQVDNVMASN